MSNIKKLMVSAAGGAGLDVEAVFSTYLYTGNSNAYGSATQTITNGIDLAGEGGMVWVKNRGRNAVGAIVDTERGASYSISPSESSAQSYNTTANINALNSDGFEVGTGHFTKVNYSGDDYASWTFRKAPKFFDVVTWTGDSASDRAISHNLGCVPGMIIVKRTNASEDWGVWHRSVHANTSKVLYLNQNFNLQTSTAIFGVTNPTDSNFYVGDHPVSNNNGDTYVAYVFAHNDGDGDFGPDGDADIIKCGSYTGGGSSDVSVDLGFEPQWLMVKTTDAANNWFMFDTMRGITNGVGNGDSYLRANLSNTEGKGLNFAEGVELTATGFELKGDFGGINQNNNTFIYMAIRRGSLFPPESATEVFAPIAYTTTDGSWQDRILESNFTTDLAINGYRNISDGGTHSFVDRLRGYAALVRSHQTNAESTRTADYYPWPQTGQFVTSNEWSKYNAGAGLDYYNYQFRRAPGFFDVVAYSGDGTSDRQISHNLGSVPALIICKNLVDIENWQVYHKDVGNDKRLLLNQTDPAGSTSTHWNNTTPTATEFTVGSHNGTNGSGDGIVAYLFASLPGISKVGSYTGNGSSQTIDCGFTAGARFVLIKRTDSSGNWFLWDSERGIVSGSEPFLMINQTNAEQTGSDEIDPHSSGFAVNQSFYTDNNVSGGSYIFYAIA